MDESGADEIQSSFSCHFTNVVIFDVRSWKEEDMEGQTTQVSNNIDRIFTFPPLERLIRPCAMLRALIRVLFALFDIQRTC